MDHLPQSPDTKTTSSVKVKDWKFNGREVAAAADAAVAATAAAADAAVSASAADQREVRERNHDNKILGIKLFTFSSELNVGSNPRIMF